MDPNEKPNVDQLVQLDELTPEEIAERGEHEDGEHEDEGDVQPAPVRPLRPGESVGGYTHD